MLRLKLSAGEIWEFPKLFISLLVTKSIAGIEIPSPNEPTSPSPISAMSEQSACMKIEPNDIVRLLVFGFFFFICSITEYICEVKYICWPNGYIGLAEELMIW
ncbi:6-phosphofructo-2-kinase/fructose-2 [Striga asiatica]|uniref:6-phosphofructo-2-kinase/fructose-2 n=1 Tax=Striga asiatica TaxID=4170 RepID=A0A5A7P9Y2_STRAF|nr:6-phosphofructo-2-kinase/fructose-2 [Striga asiatica]